MNDRQGRPLNEKVVARCKIAVAILIVFAIFDVMWLFKNQVINAEENRRKALIYQLDDREVPAYRGVIYDANMEVLAESADAFLVRVNPSKVANKKQQREIADALEEILDNKDITSDSIYDGISRNKAYGYYKIAGGLSADKAKEIRALIEDNGNQYYDIVVVETDTKRYYPYDSFASTIIGTLSYDKLGRAGLELQYDTELTGIPGRLISARDPMNNPLEPDFNAMDVPPQQGNGLVLTLDKSIQYYLEKGLSEAASVNKAKSAYGIVMDVETGGILAMATMPDYNLNEPGVLTDKSTVKKLKKKYKGEEYYTKYSEAVYTTWRNRSVSDTYEPGSVFKVIVAAAAIEEDVPHVYGTYNCTGHVYVDGEEQKCHKTDGHGVQTLQQGLMNSCNPFFITLGQELGFERFNKYFDAFGFTKKTGIDLPEEASSIYHDPDNMSDLNLSSSSFGQSFQVSAIQLVTAVSAIANDGNLMEPYIVAKKVDHEGNVIYEKEPTIRKNVVSRTTCEKVLAMMEQVVADGTGRNAKVDGYRVAGKTGTSQKLSIQNKTEYVASFVGCAPADDPKIAVLIVIDEPQVEQHGGGAIAAPVAGAVIEQTLHYLNVEPVYTEEQVEQMTITAPDVRAMSVSEARDTLDNKGFASRVVGDGEKVVSQYPAKGMNIPEGGVVVLYTEAGTQNSTAEVPDLIGLSVNEANQRAINAGFNIKFTGTTDSAGVVAISQNIEPGKKVELGTTITVRLKTNIGVQDD